MKDGGDKSGRKRLHFAPEKGLMKMKKNGSSTIYCITILPTEMGKRCHLANVDCGLQSIKLSHGYPQMMAQNTKN